MPVSRYITPDKLDAVLDDKWGGKDWHGWEGATVWTEVGRGVEASPTDELIDKIRAIQTLHVNDAFFYDPIAFEKMVTAFNGAHVDTWVIQGCTPGEIAYALETTKSLRGDRKFQDSVVEYIRACCSEAGLLCYPESLRFAEPVYTEDEAKLCSLVRAHPWKGGEPDMNNVVAVQAWKTAGVDAYVKERLAQAEPKAA